jgi:signal transduction histidine kinase
VVVALAIACALLLFLLVRARFTAAEADRVRIAELALTDERRRIAREMHDVVTHSLTAIVQQADGASYAVARHPQQAAQTLRSIASTGREALQDLRGLLGVLGYDESTQPQPGLADLEQLYERIRSTGLRLSTWEDGLPTAVSPATGLAVYRLVQEALTNVVQHAGTSAVATVRLTWTDAELLVAVSNVSGSVPPDRTGPAGAGTGLLGVKERVAAVGGNLRTGPTSAGFAVEAVLPLPAR